ncbi:MAG: ABC transporter substrate-binding protein [Clostridia bacterium]|nr:ABC transporter substrate-binding protein [Clostridia bacterium]
MKKIIATLILFTLTLSLLCSCSLFDGLTDNGVGTKIRIGYLTGPTGMGLAKLMHDNGGTEGNEKYEFIPYTDSSFATADLNKGEVDVICLATNEALKYYNSSDKSTRVLAVNCLNSLYLISDGEHKVNSLKELEGQTIYTCQNGTPAIILNYIIDSLDLDIEVSYTIDDKTMVKPVDVRSQVIDGNLPYAVIPEPIVTASLLKNPEYSVDINLADEWASIPGLEDIPVTMGCIVSTQSFIDENRDTLNAFLTEYEASVNYIGNVENVENAANYVAECKIMDAAPAAKKALTNLDGAIAYLDGKEMKSALEAFYKAMGMPLPTDEFYYEK